MILYKPNKKRSIGDLKKDFDVSYSEEIFGVIIPPEYKCVQISEMVNKIKTMTEGKLSAEETESIVNFVESFRKHCDGIRFWGKQWKSIAKNMIEEREQISDIVAPEHLDKV